MYRYHNPNMLKKYELHKRTIAVKHDPNEQYLFHGTRLNVLESILKKGLDRNYTGYNGR